MNSKMKKKKEESNNKLTGAYIPGHNLTFRTHFIGWGMKNSDRFIFFEVFYNQGKRVRVSERE